MQKLVCEMCNSNDLVKENGLFVCQHCGCKYSLEEARKLMVDGTVEIQGVVKVDGAEELSKLYQAARNAKEMGNSQLAIKHYEEISAKDPNSWEALFYPPILRTNSIKNGEIQSAAIGIANSIDMVFDLIAALEDEEEKKKALKEVVMQAAVTATTLSQASMAFYSAVTKGTGVVALTGLSGAISGLNSMGEAILEDKERRTAIAAIMLLCKDGIEKKFKLEDEAYKNAAVFCAKQVIMHNDSYKKDHNTNMLNDSAISEYVSFIKRYEPGYSHATSSSTTGGGCYVATAVYGSYDCPQVWTLRRFRDTTLAGSWFGRMFIKTYYAVSPTLVKRFGDTKWFTELLRPWLNRFAEQLQAKGFESTPYVDRKW